MKVLGPFFTVEAVRPEIEGLLDAHYREVGNTKVYTLAPDWPKYEAACKAGNCFSLLAFEEGVCVGYSVNILTPHLHYVDSLCCYNDVIFVSKPHRTGTAGGRLVAATKAQAKAIGCAVMQWHAKPGTALDRLLSKRMPVFEHAYAQAL